MSTSGNTYEQTSPIWKEDKAKNYLPHMTVPEVKRFLTNSDMVIIPVGAIEQHGLHLPVGTDHITGVELCKLIAQERDILVAPIMFPGQSPYHMDFPGSITISAETIVQVHYEAVQSLIKHGFKRFIFINSHLGNAPVTGLLVDKINQTTSAVALNFSQAVAPFLKPPKPLPAKKLSRHAGVNETSQSLYLMPNLVQLDNAYGHKIELPEHLEKILPKVVDNDPTATLLFLTEGLKARETGKKTSMGDMSETGVWGEIDPKEASLERGREIANNKVNAAIEFIDKWNELIPFNR